MSVDQHARFDVDVIIAASEALPVIDLSQFRGTAFVDGVVDKLLAIEGSTRLLGPARLRVAGEGMFLLGGGRSSLILENLMIEWIIDDRTPGDASLVCLLGGQVQLRNVTILVRSNESAIQSHGTEQMTRRQLINNSGGKEVQIDGGRFAVDREQVVAGFVWSTAQSASVSINDCIVTGFHGCVSATNIETLAIERSVFSGNWFGGIAVFDGSQVRISDSILHRQGSGASGDGLTLKNVRRASVTNSQFVRGGCYGIQILPGPTSLEVSSCAFVGGATIGIYSEVDPTSWPDRSLLVRDCIFNQNAGFGMAVQDFESVVVERCVFLDNYRDPNARDLSNYQDQYRFENCNQTKITGIVTEVSVQQQP